MNPVKSQDDYHGSKDINDKPNHYKYCSDCYN